MRRSGTGSGGGIGSRPVKHVTAPKVEPRAHAMNPGGVAQFGQSQGAHVTGKRESSYRGDPLRAGRGYQNPVGPASMALSDPGAGRTIFHCGSQDQHGSGGPPKPGGRDILGAFGAESSRPRNDER